MKAPISEKTVERLSLYRRLLIREMKTDKTHIFSHELAKLGNTTPAQVRRDIMNIGYSGTPRKGYDIKKLISCIGKILDSKETQNIALVGLGNLGKAVLTYFREKRPKLNIKAAFDISDNIIGSNFEGIECYSISKLKEVIEDNDVKIVIITSPGNTSQSIADEVIEYGVNAFVNFSPTPLNVPEDIFVEEIDITVSLEKAAYFSKINR